MASKKKASIFDEILQILGNLLRVIFGIQHEIPTKSSTNSGGASATKNDLDFLDKSDSRSSIGFGSVFRPIEYPYSVRDDFLSPAELSLYLVLKSEISDWALICPKVNLGDLFFARSRDFGQHRTYTNKIDRKHVDFLLCDPVTMRPILGIELDDKSHLRVDRQERDEFVEKVFEAAKLPLARIPVRRSYSGAELNAFLRKCVAKKDGQNEGVPTLAQEAGSMPNCPKCGSRMVLRVAKNGNTKGEQFWGCINYPHCRGILKFSAVSLEG